MLWGRERLVFKRAVLVDTELTGLRRMFSVVCFGVPIAASWSLLRMLKTQRKIMESTSTTQILLVLNKGHIIPWIVKINLEYENKQLRYISNTFSRIT
jgi:hypothetical protein